MPHHGLFFFNYFFVFLLHMGAVRQESALKVEWEKNPLPHHGVEHTSVLHLTSGSDALSTELHHHPGFKDLR